MTLARCLLLILFLILFFECRSQKVYYEGQIGDPLQVGQFRSVESVAADPNGNVYIIDAASYVIKKFDASGTPLLQWGGYGSGDGQFNTPREITVDASGNVYVMEGTQIQKFSSSGAFITKWGTPGAGDGQFSSLRGIAVDGSGNVYATEDFRIQKFSSSGVFITKWGTPGPGDGQFELARDIAVDAYENVYVVDYSNHCVQKFSSSGVFITRWGTSGTGDGQFRNPQSIAVDAGGNVYVADRTNHQIKKFSSTGAFIAKWGSSGNGQIIYPKSIAIDTNGGLYLTNENTVQVLKFSTTGTFLTKWESQSLNGAVFHYPTGLATDAAGNVYVADRRNHQVKKFSPTGAFIGSWGTLGNGNGQFNSPSDIAIDATGNVYVSDPGNSRVQKFSSAGAFLFQWNQLSPSGIAVDADGFLYVTEAPHCRIAKLSPAGNVVTRWGTCGNNVGGGFDNPSGIVVDAFGSVYVADRGNHRIQKFTSNGTHLVSFGQWPFHSLYYPRDVDVDVSGNLWVVDGGHRVHKIASNGDHLTSFGTLGSEIEQFIGPSGIAVDTRGNVYVADAGNHRIQKFSPLAVLSFSPDKGSIGTTITITGTGFSPTTTENTVRVNGTIVTITSASANSITATIPQGATTGEISVTRDGNTAASASEFLVLPLAVNSFSPTIAGVGETITINGTGFSTTPGNNVVKFNGVTAAVIQNSASQLKAIVPGGTTDGKISVTTLGQTASSSTNFRITPLIITNIDFPDNYPIGDPAVVASVEVNDAAYVQMAHFVSKGISAKDNTYKSDVVTKPANGNTLTFTMPASYFADPIGLKVYFLFTDSNGNEVRSESGHVYLRYPATSTTHAIPDLTFGSNVKDYQLISIPLQLADKKLSGVFSALGNYDNTKYRLYSHTAFSNQELNSNSFLDVGKGYWFIAKNKTTIVPGEGTTVNVTEENPFLLELRSGYNLIGNPYNFNIQWSDVLEYNDNPESVGNLIHYKNGTFAETSVLERYRGAFVYVAGTQGIWLKIPVTRDATSGGGRIKSTFPTPLDAPSWSLPITVDDGTIRNELAGIGMHPEANETIDRFDRIEIPAPVDAFTFALRKANEGTLIRDIIGTTNQYTWQGQLHSQNGAILSWDNSFFGDNDRQLVLEIEGQVELTDMRKHTQAFVPRGTHTFLIHYGDGAYIKSATRTEETLSGHAFPNPFDKNSGSIHVSMALPEGTTNIQLSLIDTKGKTAELPSVGEFDEERRVITWKNDYSKLSSGLYVLRIAVADRTGQTFFYRKLIIE